MKNISGTSGYSPHRTTLVALCPGPRRGLLSRPPMRPRPSALFAWQNQSHECRPKVAGLIAGWQPASQRVLVHNLLNVGYREQVTGPPSTRIAYRQSLLLADMWNAYWAAGSEPSRRQHGRK